MARVILWRRLDLPGHEIGRLARRDDGWELSGTAVFSHENRPCKLDYRVICAADWRTCAAQVTGAIGERDVHLRISVNSQRNWFLDATECPAVAGCLDIDLGFSPSTNLLPIRRLSLAVGQEAEVRAEQHGSRFHLSRSRFSRRSIGAKRRKRTDTSRTAVFSCGVWKSAPSGS